MPDKIVLVVRFQTKPGKKEQFLKHHLSKLLDTMSAEANFVNVIVHNNLEKPNELVVYETWIGTRETWLRDEFPRPYRKPFEQVLSELVDERSVDWLTPVDR
ncbi:MAG TPA: antibiotic biosynthesis monooxygenase [Alphaproteobacteria bacterium]